MLSGDNVTTQRKWLYEEGGNCLITRASRGEGLVVPRGAGVGWLIVAGQPAKGLQWQTRGQLRVEQMCEGAGWDAERQNDLELD